MSSPIASTDGLSAKDSAQGRSGKQPAMGKTLMTVMLGTWIGLAAAGSVAYLLVKSGTTPIVGSAPTPEAKATRSITLEPILANLSDAGGHAYVRLGLRVEIGGDTVASGADVVASAQASGEGKGEGGGEVKGPAGKTTTELESSIRDTVLAVLGRQSSADLLGPDGKEHLKIELREAMERGAVRVKVKEIFFTDFLVQI